MVRFARNSPCWCGSELKYKKCCFPEVPPEANYILREAPPNSKGTQPVRVLEGNILTYFQKTHQEFPEQLRKDITNSGLNAAISYLNIESEIMEPASIFINKQIRIEETFLSYLWINSYCLVTIFDDHILLPRLKKGAINDPLKLANKIEFLKYGVSLANAFAPWDKDKFPNPEKYLFEHKIIIEKVNSVFLHAVNFVFCHEYSHFSLGHVDEMFGSKQKTLEENKQDEIDADKNAIKLMITRTKTKRIRKNIEYGIIIGVSSLIFMSRIEEKFNYPDPEIRIKNALENLNLKDEDLHWGLASLALKIWIDFEKENIKLPVIVDTYKQCFYLMIKEIDKIKNDA